MGPLELDVADLRVPPAYLSLPPSTVSSAGAEVVDFAEAIGVPLDPEQKLALHALRAERDGGKWAALENAIVASRQNIKTHIFKPDALADIVLFGVPLVTWTAHEFATAQEAFLDIQAIIDGSPMLSRRVKKIVNENGNEGIEFKIPGRRMQRLQFKARTLTGGRGKTGDTVYMDEAFALQPSHMGSLVPTMSARSVEGNPRIVYGSSAGLLKSGVLRKLRDRGRPGGDPSLVWIEFCAPEGGCLEEDCDHRLDAKGCALDDIEKVRMANPALERRIAVWFVEAERRAMTPTEYARERLGWWEDPVAEGDELPRKEWAACAKPSKRARGNDPIIFTVDVAPDNRWASIVACGGGVVEVIEHRRGVGWLAAKLVELVKAHDPAAVGLVAAGPVGGLTQDIADAGTEAGLNLKVRSKAEPQGLLVALSGPEFVQACSSIYAAITEKVFIHRDEEPLNAAFEGAARQKVGDAWKWSRVDSSVDISPLVGATVARFLWAQGDQRPKPKPPATAKVAKATATPENFFRPTGRLSL